jgi:hypothetical protein
LGYGTVDKLPRHLFEALIAVLLEKQGYRRILTARSNDGGADAIAFLEGELWLVQAKHTKKDNYIQPDGTPVDVQTRDGRSRKHPG